MDLSKVATVEQLKAIAYDCIVKVEEAQRNLQTVNQEIANRLSEPPVTKEEVKK